MKHRSWSIVTKRAQPAVIAISKLNMQRVTEHKPMSELYQIHCQDMKKSRVINAAWMDCYPLFGSGFITTVLINVRRGHSSGPGLLLHGFIALMPQPTLAAL